MLILFLVAAIQVPDASPAPPALTAGMTLVCTGEGQEHRREVATAQVFDNRGNSASGYAVHGADHPYQDTVTVELDGLGGSRLRVPETFIPKIHGGGVDGWWKIQDLKAGDTEIVGRISFNLFDSPAVHINRTTGTITIYGPHANFAGQCEKADPAQRKF